MGKTCIDCEIQKDTSEFYKKTDRRDGLSSRCKSCQQIIDLERNICGIYKITSPSGKIYIGQSKNIDKRKRTYKIGSGYIYQTRLKNSITKYGWDLHKFEIIEICTANVLNKTERKWQDFYNVIGDNGLNCILTETEEEGRKIHADTKVKSANSRVGYKHSEETKLKISKAHKGKVVSQEIRKRQSEILKERYKKFPQAKGYKHTDETKAKLSLAHKGKKLTEEHRKNISKGNIGITLGRKHTKEALDKMRQPRYHTRGVNSLRYGIPLSEETKKRLSTSQKQSYTDNPERRRRLSESKSGEKHRQWGIPIPQHQKEAISQKLSKPVINLETGIFYASAKEVSEATGVKYSTVRGRLNGSCANKTPFRYC